MHLTVVSSLDALCRQQVCESLAAASPEALVVVHDLLDDGVVVRQSFRHGGSVRRVDTVLEHGCPSCVVRLEIVPTVAHLMAAGEQQVVLGLPPTAPASTAIHALLRRLQRPLTVDAAVLACAPSAVEDQIWENQSLFEAGCTTVVQDDRSPGEFLIGELAYNDTVYALEPDVLPVGAQEKARGLQLLRELAGHAHLVTNAADVRPGRYDPVEAIHRSTTGYPGPCASSPSVLPGQSLPFGTVVHQVCAPLHPERFQQALASMAAGCCWLRGQVWLAVAPEHRITVQGIGPRVWLENTGSWPVAQEAELPLTTAEQAVPTTTADHPRGPGTWIAATGEGVDAAEFGRLLSWCELTEAELMSGTTGLADPFGLNTIH